MPEKDADVVIVGGGPAGLATAIAAVHEDEGMAHRLLVLERSRYPRHKPCGGGLTRRAMSALSALGLSPELPMTRVVHLDVLVHNSHRRFSRRDPFFVVVDRTCFDHWLVDEARALGIMVIEDARVRRAYRDGDDVCLLTSRGLIRARVVVAADGAGSVVRRCLAETTPKRLSRLVEVRGPICGDPDAATFDFRAMSHGVQGYYWTFPFFEHDALWSNVGIFDSRTWRPREREPLVRLAARRLEFDDALQMREAFETSSYPINRWTGKAPSAVPGVLLVGDALGADGLLGEGISVALQHGIFAGTSIAVANGHPLRSAEMYDDMVRESALSRELERRSRLARLLYSPAGGQVADLTLTLLSAVGSRWARRVTA